MELEGYALGEELARGAHLLLRAERRADGLSVVLKIAASGPDPGRAAARLRHEYELTRSLPEPHVVPPVELTPFRGGVALVLRDVGGRPLRELMDRPLPVEAFLPLAESLVDALAAVHEAGVIHKDVKPSNVLILSSGEARWTDFGLAVRLRSERVTRLAGTLTYMAPEQTGRMNRSLDARADLYALGVVFWEMLAGEPPFRADDPMELVHAHIARPPPSLAARRPELPALVVRIVERLLRKSADARYQTARGLAADLRRCRSELDAGRVPEFELGASDRRDGLRLPQRLVGREREVETLRKAWTEASAGPPGLVVLEGRAGVGKTSLVGELLPLVAESRGLVLRGACEPLGHDTPLAALLRGLAELLRRLLAGSEDSVRSWGSRLSTAAGPAARVLADLVPELELVLGPLPTVPELPPAEADERLRNTAVSLLQALASPRHPLLIVLDDAQWSGGALIRLLAELLEAGSTGHLLLVLSRRPGEGPDPAPLFEAARSSCTLSLEPLRAEHIGRWLAPALEQDEGAVEPLAALLQAKTAGNPYFVERFVARLRDLGLLRRDDAGWTWDLAAIGALELSDNVAEILEQELGDLPADTQEALGLASFLGARFSSRLLASAGAGAAVARALAPAVESGHLDAETEGWQVASELPDGVELHYRFAHDRIREAAYARVPEADRPGRHLAIGRLLLDTLGDEEQAVFDVAGHLQRGRDGLSDPAERARVAEVLVRAARRALDASGVETASAFVESARLLLGDDPWARDHELARSVCRVRGEAAFLAGRVQEMEEATAELLAHGRSAHEQVDALELRLHAYSHLARHDEALDACVDALRLLGRPVPRRPSAVRGGLELVATSLRLRNLEPESLHGLPPMEDPDVQRSLRLMLMAGAAAQARAPGLFALILARSVRVNLQHGLAPDAPLTYLSYGFALSVVLGQREKGYRFGREAIRLLGPPERSPLTGQILTIFNTYVCHWREPRGESLDDYAVAARAAIQHGDREYAAYNLAAWVLTAIQSGRSLTEVQVRSLEHHREVVRFGQPKMHATLAVARAEIRSLTGRDDPGPDPGERLQGATAERWLEESEDDYVRWLTAAARSMGGVLREEPAVAFEAAEVARGFDRGVFGAHQYLGMVWRCMGVLAAADLARREPSRRSALRRWTRGPRKALARAADEAPFNYAPMHALAEAAWVPRGSVDGLRLLQQAWEQAREQRMTWLEVLAAQRALRHHEELGFSASATTWRQAAWGGALRWGADALARGLEEEDPTLRAHGAPLGLDRTTNSTSSSSEDSRDGHLDLASLLKASQALAGELVLAQVLERLLAVALQNAGATRAAIVLDDEGQPQVAATSDGAEAGPLDEAEGLPASVVRYALRTGQDVVLADARREGLFSDDPWIRSHKARSVLAVPLVHQGRSVAALYLENSLTEGAFTPARVEMMRAIAAQAAVAVENARLYEAQVALTEAQSRFVPHQFLRSLDREDIVRVGLGDAVSRDMAILFSDLRGFTALAERLGPDRTLEVLNRYLAMMEPGIAGHGGFVDSYIGDAILALFEAGPDGAAQAAVAMCAALRELNRDSDEPLAMGIGINAGPLTLGTIGARDRLSCTVIGDSVNLAARLEGLTKEYGVQVLVGEQARLRLARPDALHLRLVGRVAVQGRSEPTGVYQLVDAEAPAVRERLAETRATYDAAVDAFFGRRFAEAEEGFAAVVDRDPSDPVAARFLERARALLADPPGEDWTGVEQQLHK